MARVKVNVLDTITGKIALEGCSMMDASKLTGVTYKAIQNAIDRNSTVNGKYRIIKTGEFFKADGIEEPKKTPKSELEIEWDRVINHPTLWKTINTSVLGQYGNKFKGARA